MSLESPSFFRRLSSVPFLASLRGTSTTALPLPSYYPTPSSPVRLKTPPPPLSSLFSFLSGPTLSLFLFPLTVNIRPLNALCLGLRLRGPILIHTPCPHSNHPQTASAPGQAPGQAPRRPRPTSIPCVPIRWAVVVCTQVASKAIQTSPRSNLYIRCSPSSEARTNLAPVTDGKRRRLRSFAVRRIPAHKISCKHGKPHPRFPTCTHSSMPNCASRSVGCLYSYSGIHAWMHGSPE